MKSSWFEFRFRLVLLSASSLLCAHSAFALSQPDPIMIDGGPLGPIQLSGGADGYFYEQSGTSSSSGSSTLGSNENGVNLGSALIQLQKTTGVIQFNMEIAATDGTPTLGEAIGKADVDSVGTSPLYVGTITIAPTGMPFKLTAGEVDCVEGPESSFSWNNANLFLSSLYSVENGPSRGVEVDYTHGPLTATVIYGDGWDTGVFNFLQAALDFQFNDNNELDIYYGGNLGRTGLNTRTYTGTSVADFGPYFMNSQMFGAYYSYTHGNLNLLPEIQYVYAKVDHQIGIDNFTSNFGAALITDYNFENSPYSLGGMAEYFTSNGLGDWFIAPGAQGFGVEATPSWQYKHLFLRASVGFLHLITGGAYGNSGNGKNVVQTGLNGGIIF
ncbi:outer membrane beta-barrel protein [Acidocella sp.]|uniref:outer membrane beta-barrel protein n=1 Tax=Acidocella sp. TaxID=50710 RepID=UPI002631689C|nr:outer membrane beta-barrel protein [Acidocella sp.]